MKTKLLYIFSLLGSLWLFHSFSLWCSVRSFSEINFTSLSNRTYISYKTMLSDLTQQETIIKIVFAILFLTILVVHYFYTQQQNSYCKTTNEAYTHQINTNRVENSVLKEKLSVLTTFGNELHLKLSHLKKKLTLLEVDVTNKTIIFKIKQLNLAVNHLIIANKLTTKTNA